MGQHQLKPFGIIAGVMDNDNILILRLGEYIEITEKGYTVPLERSQMWRVKELYEDGDPRCITYYGKWRRQPILKTGTKLPPGTIQSCQKHLDQWTQESWRAAFVWCQSKSINILNVLTQSGLAVKIIRNIMDGKSSGDHNQRLKYFMFLRFINVEYFSLIGWYVGRKSADPAWCNRMMEAAYRTLEPKQTSDFKSSTYKASKGDKISRGRKKAAAKDEREQRYEQMEVPKELIQPDVDRSNDGDILKSWESE